MKTIGKQTRKAQQPVSEIRLLVQQAEKFLSIGNIQGAINTYKEWLEKNPRKAGSHLIWFNYGAHHQTIGNIEIAEAAYKAALEQKPQMYIVTINLGLILESQGRFNELLSLWGEAPDFYTKEETAELLNNKARVLKSLKNYAGAIELLTKSVTISPKLPSIMELMDLRKGQCIWPLLIDEIPKHLQEDSLGPVTVLLEYDDPAKALEATKRYVMANLDCSAKKKLTAKGCVYKNHKKLRIGFLSADFRTHAASSIFIHVMKRLNRERFEVYGLDITTRPDIGGQRKALIDLMDCHIDLTQLSDEAAAKIISANEIDILIDMSLHTEGSRINIPAQRPAPIQMSYIGFLGASGLPTFDYLVTTEYLFPEKYKRFYTEKPLYLPDVHMVIAPDEKTTRMPQREEYNLPKDAFVFGALMNINKICQPVFDTWLEVLNSVKNSVLWIQGRSEAAVKNLLSHAASKGFDTKRIILAPVLDPQEYRNALTLCDIFLDSFPASNGATAADAIIANLPILTLPGKTQVSRVSASLMTVLKMPEIICSDLLDYKNKAIALGLHPEASKTLKEKLIINKRDSPLFDIDSYVKNFEKMLEQAVSNFL